MNKEELLQQGAKEYGIVLSQQQISQFLQYEELLADWNTRMNITRVPREEYIARHFVDSLSVCLKGEGFTGERIIDIGSGGGFPGIPLKIAFPEISMTLVEATGKKVQFLEEVIHQLNLENIRACHARAEDLLRLEQYRSQFDYVTARAVKNLKDLLGWTIPFLKKKGTALFLKGNTVEESELPEARKVFKEYRIRLDKLLPVFDPFKADEQVGMLVVLRKE